MKFIGKQIQIEPPKNPKRITGTRFASVLGLDVWNTDFKTWCAITKTYEEPFVDNKYTIAGKTIEPKVIDYLRNVYMLNLKTPEDIYGKDYFKKTWGNFFPNSKCFGGMWDSLLVNENGEIEGVIEIKTSSRPQDWEHDVPENYAIQASLYAYLLDVDDVIMVASLLDDKDYINPDNFVPSADNTIIRTFKVSERYEDFGKFIETAEEWWDNYVVTGISPEFDEIKDKEILDNLRTNTLENPKDLENVLKELNQLTITVDNYKAQIKEDEKRIKELKDIVKNYAIENFGENDTKVELMSDNFVWEVSKNIRETIDKKALEKDGLLDKYVKQSESYRITNRERDN